MEIHGIPEKREENLKGVIISNASQLDVDICSQDISRWKGPISGHAEIRYKNQNNAKNLAQNVTLKT